MNSAGRSAPDASWKYWRHPPPERSAERHEFGAAQAMVQHVVDAAVAGMGQDAAVPERARPIFQRPMKAAHNLAMRDHFTNHLLHVQVVRVREAVPLQRPLNFRVGERRAEEDVLKCGRHRELSVCTLALGSVVECAAERVTPSPMLGWMKILSTPTNSKSR